MAVRSDDLSACTRSAARCATRSADVLIDRLQRRHTARAAPPGAARRVGGARPVNREGILHGASGPPVDRPPTLSATGGRPRSGTLKRE